MKTKNMIMSLLLSLPIFLSSCEEELEVGTTLNPETGDVLDVKAYIDNHCFYPKNYFETKVVQTANKDQMFISEQKISLKVQLTNAATKDLSFSMVYDDTQEDKNKMAMLGEDAITFEKQEVTIPCGKIESDEPFVFMLNPASESLKNFEGSALAKLKLVSKNDIEISKDYNSYSWKVNKEVTNINENGDLSTKEEIPVHLTTYLKSFYGNLTSSDELVDNNLETSSSGYIGTADASIQFKFDEPQEIVGIIMRATTDYWSGGVKNRSVKVTIYGGMEEETSDTPLQKIGTAIAPFANRTLTEEELEKTDWKIEFYSPVKVKHIRIERLQAYDKESSLVGEGEVRFYKNK